MNSCLCVRLTLHEFSQEGDGLRQQHHVVLLQFGRHLHEHQQRGETHLWRRRKLLSQ